MNMMMMVKYVGTLIQRIDACIEVKREEWKHFSF
jgi:hypothetical protein